MAVPNIFAAQSGQIPLSQLDANFAAFQSPSNVLYGAGLVGYAANLAYGTGTIGLAIPFVNALVEPYNVVNDGSEDMTSAIQAIMDDHPNGCHVYFPAGTYLISDAEYLKYSNTHWFGDGFGLTKFKFVNAAGGTAVAGATSTAATITNCSIRDISFISTAAGTDPTKYIDITTMSYSDFWVDVQTKRVNSYDVYGVGNSGSSPYYNRIGGMFFGNSTSQTGIFFGPGSWAGGSNGPNGNIIGPILRAAALDIAVDIQSGNGNMIANVNTESIGTAHYRLNYQSAATETGTSSGSNTMSVLKDSGKSWTVNAYANYAVKITGGTGSGQVRIISSNTSTQLTLKSPWGTLPDNTSTYSIYKNSGTATKIVNCRGEGSSGADFISAYPGSQQNKASGCVVDSLGAGLFVRDDTGAFSNNWYDGSKASWTENIQNPGPSANIDVWVKNSTLGGVHPAGQYAVESLFVASNTATLSDTATVRLDVGGTTAGNGDITLTVALPTGNSEGSDMPSSTGRVLFDGTNKGLFLNVQTGGSFSATADLQITVVAYVGC